MTRSRWWRWTVALLLGVGVVLGPAPPASAAPAPSAGVGMGAVFADLGVVVPREGRSGFSFDGRYYSYLVRAADGCVVHVYDLQAREQVPLTHALNSHQVGPRPS